jgi:hypothetical protein
MGKIVIAVLALTFLLNSNIAAADSTSTVTPKSKHTALIHSLGWTIVPTGVGLALTKNERTRGYGIGLTSFGVLIGPGTGHLYAHQMKPLLVGAGIRGLVVISTTLVAAAIANSARDKSWDESMGQFALYVCVAGAGLALCTASAIYDFGAVGNSVDRYNHRHGFANVRITPTYFVNRRAPGVLLTLSL